MMKNAKAGFTLAEVLTTLMVIGVVAAMTIPTLMNSTQNQQSAVAAKKASSVLGQAIQLLMSRDESCPISADNPSNDLAACMSHVMSGSLVGNNIKTADGMSYYFYAPTGGTNATLQSVCGSAFLSTTGAGSCGVVVDTNGEGKTTTSGYPTANAFNNSGFTSNPQQDKDVIAFAMNSQSIKPIVWSDGINNTTELLYGKAGVYAASKICVNDDYDINDVKCEGSNAIANSYALDSSKYTILDSAGTCPSGSTDQTGTVKAIVNSCPEE